MGEWNQRLTDLGRTETRANSIKGERVLGRTNSQSIYMTLYKAE